MVLNSHTAAVLERVFYLQLLTGSLFAFFTCIGLLGIGLWKSNQSGKPDPYRSAWLWTGAIFTFLEAVIFIYALACLLTEAFDPPPEAEWITTLRIVVWSLVIVCGVAPSYVAKEMAGGAD